VRNCAALLGLGAALSGCVTWEAVMHPAPRAEPGGEAGSLRYSVGSLSFEAPAGWEAHGDGRKVSLAAPDGKTTLQASVVASRGRDEKACLAAAAASLEQASGSLRNVRRHPTSIAGRNALEQEADGGEGRWHGWAYAICDGSTQYRLFFGGPTPLPPEAMAAYKRMVATARLGAR
jgi:hypothetical protein